MNYAQKEELSFMAEWRRTKVELPISSYLESCKSA